MKVVLPLMLLLGAHFAAASQVQMQDKTITKVVKLLQTMLKKSKAEGEEETKIFAKFKCYCDMSTAEKNEAIADNTKTIAILESKIEELQGSNGELSSQCADLKARIADNKAKQEEATGIREKENKKFNADEKDFTQAIAQMKSALETLAAVGGDQTANTGADSSQFLAGHKSASLLSLQSTMQSALSAAEAFMDQKQFDHVTSFIQAPFTGTYSSQSGAVVGIIKNMADTFKANLKTAIADEATQLKAYDEFMEIKAKAKKEMEGLYNKAQEELGDNDGDLSAKRTQLSNAEKQLKNDEEFMEKLVPMCKDKTTAYDERKLLRAGEEVAVAQAISILNSDAAFATFSTVDATSKGAASFLQVAKKHFPGVSDEDVRQVMQRLLKRAAVGQNMPRIAHVISALQAENPFDTVLKEITKMVENIKAEGKADTEKKEWCEKERTDNKASLKEKNGDLLKLEGKIAKLTKSIEDEATGFKAQIAKTQTSLEENHESQVTETADRKEANAAYQADVKNLVAAEQLVDNAINVLKAYYDQFDSLLQEDPAPPKTWKKDSYSGQGAEKKGGAIGMLEFILEETQKEESEAHKDEETAQASYEDSMTELKKLEASSEKSLGELQDKLADAEEDLLGAKEDHKATTTDRDAVEDYLSKIKPGCDFIKTNYDLRVKNRATETGALKTAESKLKGSPAYKAAENDATEESYGKCKDTCVKDVNNVKCKACMADVTIPAYCAGHKGTAGC